MKKYIKLVIICVAVFAVVFVGTFLVCDRMGVFETEATETTKEMITDVSGRTIPSHSDVEKSTLDPDSFVRDENGRVTYNDASVTTYTGIDVSVFQGDIDWTAVKNDGIDFVMLRAGLRGYGSKGIMAQDDNFDKNYEGAKAAGLKVGVYFFSQATTEEEAAEEAEFLIEIIKDKQIDYPIAYDWEFVDNDEARTNGMSSSAITACAVKFCEVIKNAGYKPIIYFNCEVGYFNYDLSLVSDLNFWLAEYYDTPSFYYDYKMWQYTKTGTVNGISGNVDLNISIVDFSAE